MAKLTAERVCLLVIGQLAANAERTIAAAIDDPCWWVSGCAHKQGGH